MKYFCLYIFFLLCFIVFMSYYNTKEGFTNNSKSYVLLGDSILKNDAYVSNGMSVNDFITERNKNSNVHCFAEDHSKIVDIYSQIDKIPIDLNLKNTFIILSAGGNDILSHYVDQNQDITSMDVLKSMFSAYKNIIKTIQTKLPNANIVLLDIYYPENLHYKRFHSIIKEWNTKIYHFAEDPKNNIYSVIRISSHLTKPEDFSFGIEPSSIGGKKIADSVVFSL